MGNVLYLYVNQFSPITKGLKMSNCIQPRGNFRRGVILDQTMFIGILAVEDTEGNKIFRSKRDGWVLKMGRMTTWRGFRCFLWDHVQPFVNQPRVKIPTLIADEGDGFAESFTATVDLFAPETKSADVADWTKIFP